MTNQAGYSKRSLSAKLSLKPGMLVSLVDAPEGYPALVLPNGVSIHNGELPSASLDFVQWFVLTRAVLEADFPRWKAAIKLNGALWISWLKGKSGKPASGTDLNENIIREVGLAFGLVDVKVIAIDARWSGLKFVYRLEDRR
jgi:hypothetical protein